MMPLITKPRMWVYHSSKPEGRLVWQEEGEELLEKGWVRNPNLLNVTRGTKKQATADSKSEKFKPLEG